VINLSFFRQPKYKGVSGLYASALCNAVQIGRAIRCIFCQQKDAAAITHASDLSVGIHFFILLSWPKRIHFTAHLPPSGTSPCKRAVHSQPPWCKNWKKQAPFTRKCSFQLLQFMILLPYCSS